MKKNSWGGRGVLGIIACLWLLFVQTLRNKEIVRNRFLELKTEIDLLVMQLNQSFLKDTSSPVHRLIDNNEEAITFSEEKQQFFWFLSYGHLLSSPDYDTILQTGMYYEGQGPDGFYNMETLMDSIKNVYYTYSISDVQRKGRNQYDVCITGAVSYRGSHWDDEGKENEFIRGPFRIDTCYPFILRDEKVSFDIKRRQ